jgi:hypothetical protein
MLSLHFLPLPDTYKVWVLGREGGTQFLSTPLAGNLFLHQSCDSPPPSSAKARNLILLIVLARHQWLTSVILATQEAEIRRITV